MPSQSSSPNNRSSFWVSVLIALFVVIALGGVVDLFLVGKGVLPPVLPENLDQILTYCGIVGAIVAVILRLFPQLLDPEHLGNPQTLKAIVAGVLIVCLLFSSVLLIPRIKILFGGGFVTPTPSPTASLVITNTPITPAPSPTPVLPNPYPPYSGTLVFSDPLKDNSQGYNWYNVDPDPSDPNSNGGCKFTGGAYHVYVTQSGYYNCNEGQSFKNFTFEVQLKILKGGGCGVLFRNDSHTSRSYSFLIGADGSYLFLTTIPNSTLSRGSAGTLNSSDQSYLVAIVAAGNHIQIYVNHKKVVDLSDSTFSDGNIGLVAEGVPADVQASNAKLWDLGG